MAPLPTSIRQAILTAIVDAFTAAQVNGEPISTVAFGPLADEDRRKRFAIGVVPGRDTNIQETSFTQHELEVDIEFSVAVQSTDTGNMFRSAALMSETLLTVCQLTMLADPRWGGLAIDTNEIGSETGVRVYAARNIRGVLNTIVRFRHRVGDPRDPMPGFG